MRCFIGFGSNLGNPRDNLEIAAGILSKNQKTSSFRISPIYQTPALTPQDAPLEWDIPYLNAVAEIDWSGSAQELLQFLKSVEVQIGRVPGARWAPRVLDLDLLTFGSEVIHEPDLQVPHSEILHRSFVLDPLKDLAPHFVLPGDREKIIHRARHLSSHSPLLMAIVNVTPDSFSDGGQFDQIIEFEDRIKELDQLMAPIIDIGAESTRPHAEFIDARREWQRLKPALEITRNYSHGKATRPLISVDTRKAEVAEKALEMGADWINDVSGLADPKMIDVLKNSRCNFVIMHSLTVPADSQVTLPNDCDPIKEVRNWLEQKLDLIDRHGIPIEKVIFDPGLGFGKTPDQCVRLLRRMNEFTDLPVRTLVGHSRKSWMKKIRSQPLKSVNDRDIASLAASMNLIHQGVDILRVHDIESHQIALQTHQEINS
ncbi:MAG: hypothetical protein COT73_06615 [Bdellovibrio sp. CG10_big_fil_rev_8_21_14_0_10_47_8]|nr:MAG: hypothetical protein COT73_06615 [Bdellovibrio sp. CG10_big_fil_rev_8_21_14_0_10_47_8]